MIIVLYKIKFILNKCQKLYFITNSTAYNGDIISGFEASAPDQIDFISNGARMNGSTTNTFDTDGIVDNTTAFIAVGANVSQGASATIGQATAGIDVGTFDSTGTNDRIYIGWDDGSNSYIGLVTADRNSDGFTGDALSLICTLSGFADCSSLSGSNFLDFS